MRGSVASATATTNANANANASTSASGLLSGQQVANALARRAEQQRRSELRSRAYAPTAAARARHVVANQQPQPQQQQQQLQEQQFDEVEPDDMDMFLEGETMRRGLAVQKAADANVVVVDEVDEDFADELEFQLLEADD